jgi:transcription elongation GreA/GreB family factor
MKITDPREFARTMAHHLNSQNEIDLLSPKLFEDIARFEKIEEQIFRNSKKCDDLKAEIVKLEKDYQLYNFRYGLGDAQTDFEKTKQLRKETWSELFETAENRDNLYKEIAELRGQRDEISRNVGEIKRKIKLTSDFFNYYKLNVSLFSIVSVEIKGSSDEFLLLTEYQRDRAWLKDLSIYSAESPIGKACLGKRVGESFSYLAPNGAQINGQIVRCELPTLEQMEQIVTQLNRATVITPSPKVDLNGWTSNNTRYRKGG